MIVNYDDERIKISILEERVNNCVSQIMIQGNLKHLHRDLDRALYESIMYTVESHYWQYPLLSRRLRNWIDNAMRSHRDVDDCSAVAAAIRSQLPAAQIESLLDSLDGISS